MVEGGPAVQVPSGEEYKILGWKRIDFCALSSASQVSGASFLRATEAPPPQTRVGLLVKICFQGTFYDLNGRHENRKCTCSWVLPTAGEQLADVKYEGVVGWLGGNGKKSIFSLIHSVSLSHRCQNQCKLKFFRYVRTSLGDISYSVSLIN